MKKVDNKQRTFKLNFFPVIANSKPSNIPESKSNKALRKQQRVFNKAGV